MDLKVNINLDRHPEFISGSNMMGVPNMLDAETSSA
jgi:hypothetical protein